MIIEIGLYYLYRHIRIDTNEVFYVGIGTKKNNKSSICKSAYYRAYEKGNRNNICKKIFAKNKENFKVDVLFESDNYDFIKDKEKEFIKIYGRINNKTGSLANLTDGGEGLLGRIVSQEERNKTSIRCKGQVSPRKGVFLSEDQKLHLSIIQLGRKLSEKSIIKRTKNRLKNANERGFYHNKETKDKIGTKNSKSLIQYDLNLNIIQEFVSCHDVERKLGFKFGTISKACITGKVYKNYIWKYK